MTNILRSSAFFAALIATTIIGGICQSAKAANEVPYVIFDTDMGNDVDDVLALDLLIKYHLDGKIRLLAVVNNRDATSAPQFCEHYLRWAGLGHIPVGTITNGSNPTPEETSYSYKTLRQHNYDRETTFPSAVDVYRRVLQRVPNKSVIIVSVGFSSNIARLMQLTPDADCPVSGLELLRKKVSWMSIMAGNFRKEKPEYNVINDIPAARLLFENPPVPIAFSDFEVGPTIKYPATSISNDFAWAKQHPLVDAYCNYQPMPYDRPTWDPTSALYAVEPNAGFFSLSERGTVKVDDKGVTRFTPSETGQCRYLKVDDAQRKRILDHFIKVITRPYRR